MSHNHTQTLVVGFDALDFRYLDRFSLPNIERVRAKGVEAPLESTHPPWTASAWPSMYTGTDPSYHGVSSFFTRDGYPDEVSIVSRNDVKQPALWNYLTEIGRSSVVLNLPVTHPAEELDGVLIPGYLASEETPGSPASIRSELSDRIGESYRIYSRAETSPDAGKKLAGYLDLIDMRRRAAVELLDSRDWDLAIIEIQKTDAVFHNFDENTEFRQVYEAADDFLGSLLDTVDETVNVVICSDHGMGPKTGYAIYLNEILRQHGFVESTSDGEDISLSGAKSRLVDDAAAGDNAETGLWTRTLLSVGSALQRVGISPADIYTTARRVGLESTLEAVVPGDPKETLSEAVDWGASTAYCRNGAELGVRINLAGREPDGIVPKAEYKAVRDRLVELFRTIETPDGEPAFDRVVSREAAYSGPHASEMCDIILVPRGMNHTLGTKLHGRAFAPIDIHDHMFEGVCLAAGPDIETDAALSTLSLVDIAPLAMALLGEPVPERMTGEAPTEILRTAVRTEPYGTIPFGTETETTGTETEVTDRLEDLGYL
jgi:predicted AlkP superfamily phosphohydrolase/phosphomutase